MIATHNTFTYKKAPWYWEILSPWWRCQSLSAQEQIKAGATVCDIRVDLNSEGFALCHGAVVFTHRFMSLDDLIYECLSAGFIYYRIIFSSGATQAEVEKIFADLPYYMRDSCVCAVHQPTWHYIKGNDSLIKEHNKHMWYKNWTLWDNIRNFLFPTIKQYAKRNNKRGYNNIDMYDYIQYMK